MSISIQPYIGVSLNVIDSVSSALSRTYHTDVNILREKPIPESAFTNIKLPRYRADTLIHILNAQHKKNTINIGITDLDISCTKKAANGKVKEPTSKYRDWGIFGLGYVPGYACVISTFRIHHKDKKVFIKRIQKIAIHEVGHNLGLNHCSTKGCVMQDAVESINTIDQEGMNLCSSCLRKAGL